MRWIFVKSARWVAREFWRADREAFNLVADTVLAAEMVHIATVWLLVGVVSGSACAVLLLAVLR